MNQTKYRISNWYEERPQSGTRKTKAAISKILELDSDIIVLTETSDAIDLSREFPASVMTKSYDLTPIDHICISNSFIDRMKNLKVGAWNHFTESGSYMSDHNGVSLKYLDLHSNAVRFSKPNLKT